MAENDDDKVTVGAQVPRSLAKRIDAWAASLPAETSRSAALRAIIEAGLEALGTRKRTARSAGAGR